MELLEHSGVFLVLRGCFWLGFGFGFGMGFCLVGWVFLGFFVCMRTGVLGLGFFWVLFLVLGFGFRGFFEVFFFLVSYLVSLFV